MKKDLSNALIEILPDILGLGVGAIIKSLGGSAVSQEPVGYAFPVGQSPVLNPASIQIRRIENGFLVRFEGAQAMPGVSPEEFQKAVEQDLADGLDKTRMERRQLYRWKRQEHYCRDYRAVCRTMPHALQGLVLHKSVDTQGPSTAFL